LIRQPEFVTHEIVQRAKEEVLERKGLDLVKEIKFEEIAEGRCVQILHVGPYSTEPESNGFHHEIYLSDPRKTPAERLRTILRQPVKEKG